jgi:hypothetical protein
MLRTALGPAIARFLEDPAIVEVMLNPDGRLWVDRLSEGLSDTGERLSPSDGERIIRLVAHHVGAEVHPGAPRVSAELPETGERFEGLLAVQSFQGTPLLQASEAGISFYNPSSSMFIRWSDVMEFRPVNFRCLQIRLRDGAQPVESNWMRVLGASILASPQGTPFWASRKSVVVQMFTTVPRPADVARALTEIQARRLAG